MDRHSLSFSDFDVLILQDALVREWKLLEIVTAKEREAGNRDGWALARIKVRAVRGMLSHASWVMRRASGRDHLSPEDEANLADRVAAMGLKMKPPRSELERIMSVKARRRAMVRKARPAVTEGPALEPEAVAAKQRDEAPHKPRWTAPQVK